MEDESDDDTAAEAGAEAIKLASEPLVRLAAVGAHVVEGVAHVESHAHLHVRTRVQSLCLAICVSYTACCLFPSLCRSLARSDSELLRSSNPLAHSILSHYSLAFSL